MTDLIAGITLAAAVLEAFAIVGILLQYGREQSARRSERRDLLNRVMARSYSEFVYTTTATTAETPQLTTDEAEAKWAISHRGDADQIWHEENAREHPELYPDGVGEVA